MTRMQRMATALAPVRYRLPLRFKFDEHEAELTLLGDLFRGGMAIDVGANYGSYTYALVRYADRVEAFEPQPWCAQVIEAWGNPSVRVHRVALSDHVRTDTLTVPLARTWRGTYRKTGLARLGTEEGERVRVPVRRLDDFGFTDVSFIKIDVEGHELSVIRGAQETLTRYRPTLLVEIEARHSPVPIEQAFAEILSFGYRGWFLLNGQQPIANFRQELHQRVTDALCGPDPQYVNNFIFEPA